MVLLFLTTELMVCCKNEWGLPRWLLESGSSQCPWDYYGKYGCLGSKVISWDLKKGYSEVHRMWTPYMWEQSWHQGRQCQKNQNPKGTMTASQPFYEARDNVSKDEEFGGRFDVKPVLIFEVKKVDVSILESLFYQLSWVNIYECPVPSLTLCWLMEEEEGKDFREGT